MPYSIMMLNPRIPLPPCTILMISASLMVPLRILGSICLSISGASTEPLRLISMCISTE